MCKCTGKTEAVLTQSPAVCEMLSLGLGCYLQWPQRKAAASGPSWKFMHFVSKAVLWVSTGFLVSSAHAQHGGHRLRREKPAGNRESRSRTAPPQVLPCCVPRRTDGQTSLYRPSERSMKDVRTLEPQPRGLSTHGRLSPSTLLPWNLADQLGVFEAVLLETLL